MKNIFVEGIQGAGKSTLTNALASCHPQYKVCREGDYNPVELAWCTYMTEQEYQAMLERYPSLAEEIKEKTTVEGGYYIVTYTRILTDVLGFHKDLERFEIYNGRRSFDEIKEIIMRRYANFTGEGYLFECAFFQNIVEDLILFHQLSDDEIVEFYRELYEKVDKDKFMLLYLYSENIEEHIRIIKEERSDAQGNPMWYPLMLGYLTSCPYGQAHDYKDFEDMIAHFKHRQELEMRIIREVMGENAQILPAKQWDMESLKL